MRNKVGQPAIVLPWEGAADDIKRHGGKMVTPTSHRICGLGSPAWHTEPQLFDGYGNSLAWDDRDLKPLGRPQTARAVKVTHEAWSLR